MDFVQRVIGLITKPDETMKDIVAAPRIEESLVIVAAYVILLMIGTYLTLTRTTIVLTDTTTVSSETMKTFMMVFGLGGVLVMTILLWPIITAILHVFSLVFGGEGKFFPTMLTGIGYSYVPKLLSAIVTIVLATQIPLTTIEVSSTGAYSATGASLTGTLYYVQLAANLLFLLWSCYLGVLAVKNGEKVSKTNALIVVGVPLVIYLIFTFGLGFLFKV